MADDDCAFGKRIEAESLRTRTQLEKLWARLDSEHDKIVKIESWQEFHTKSVEQLSASIEVLSKKLDVIHDEMNLTKGGINLGKWFSDKWMSIAALLAAMTAWVQK